MKRQHFPSWARPYEFSAQLLSKLGRAEEGRDAARVALCLPWWTLSDGFQAATALAELPADSSEVRRRMTEASRASQKGGQLPPGVGPAPETEQQVRNFALLLCLSSMCVLSLVVGRMDGRQIHTPVFQRSVPTTLS